jgi:hypothetical protein
VHLLLVESQFSLLLAIYLHANFSRKIERTPIKFSSGVSGELYTWQKPADRREREGGRD